MSPQQTDKKTRNKFDIGRCSVSGISVRGWNRWSGLGERRCFYCGTTLILGRDAEPNRATIDHVQPKCRGGSNNKTNIVSSCATCNGDKGSLTLAEYRLVQAYRHGLVQIGQDVMKFFGEQANV